MTKPITIFRSTNGLNTLIDPARLYSSKNGVQDLAVSSDIEIGDSGRISRRKGYTLQNSVPAHSLFCDGGECIFISGTSLCLLAADYTYTVIGTVTEGARMGACQVNDEIYWCNGHEKGRVKNGTALEWEKGTCVGPETDRVLSDPPTGVHIEHYNGRMYVAQGKALWFSEPLSYGAFDLARGVIPFPSDIRIIRAVKTGLWVGTEHDIHFLSGVGPEEFFIIKKASYPGIEWSDAKLEGTLIFAKDGGGTITKSGDKAAMWMSERGICYAGSEGQFYNLTENKIQTLPNGLSGSGLVWNGKYLGLIDP